MAESLRFAMLGALSEDDGAFAQPQQLQAVRARFPQLWHLGLGPYPETWSENGGLPFCEGIMTLGSVRSLCTQALPLMGEVFCTADQCLWTSFAQFRVRLICQDVSKMANDMAKLAEVAEVSGALQVQEVRFV